MTSLTPLVGFGRFEVTYYDPNTKRRKVFGRADTQEGAAAMQDSIRLHPGMEQPQIEEVMPPPIVQKIKLDSTRRSYEMDE